MLDTTFNLLPAIRRKWGIRLIVTEEESEVLVLRYNLAVSSKLLRKLGSESPERREAKNPEDITSLIITFIR